MKPQRIGRLRNTGKGIEGHIRIGDTVHLITVVPNAHKQSPSDADMFVLLIPRSMNLEKQIVTEYEAK